MGAVGPAWFGNRLAELNFQFCDRPGSSPTLNMGFERGGARGKGRATTCRRTVSTLPDKFLSFVDAKFSPSTVAHAEVLH